MLDFEKEKMVKVAALKNLPNVLKIHREDNQQERSLQGSRRMVQSHTNRSAAYPLRRRRPHPFGFTTVFPPAHSMCSALPYRFWDFQINDSFTFFQSEDCNIPRPSQQIRKGERPNPPCAPASAFLRKQVTGWSWNTLLLNFTISLEGRNNIKPNSSALWRI